MQKNVRLLFYIAVALVIIFCILVFTPASYNVIVAGERPGTKYWNLATGSKIAYSLIVAKGDKKTFPVIYLHGGPGAGITNKEVEVLSQLADDGYDVYLYDQIGCGLSARLKNINEYSPERHKRDLAEIITKINAEKVILAGQSWGSILSLLYLAEEPAKIAKLIITAPGNIQPAQPDPPKVPVPDSIHLKPYYADRRYQLISGNLRARASIHIVKNYGRKLAPDLEADKLLTYLTTELNRSMVCDTSNAVVAEGTEGFYSHYMTLRSLGSIKDPRPALKNMHLPVLIMKGECDIQPWEYTAEYFRIFPQAEFRLIKNGGHNLFTEQPAIYINTIRNFLARQ